MGKKILFVGKFCLDEVHIKNLLKEIGFIGIAAEFIKDFVKIKKRFSYGDYSPRNYEMIVVGQVPHKSHGTGDGRSLTSDVCTFESDVPVYICRDESGRLKATKQSISKVLKLHLETKEIENLD